MNIDYKTLEIVAGEMSFNIHRDGQVNIWGIRTPNGEFNDQFVIWRYQPNGVFALPVMIGTTDPGQGYLQKIMGNKNGTAVLVDDMQYRKCWKLGYHNRNKPNKYLALVQSEKAKFKVWRDKDKNGIITYGGEIYYDVSGLNLHTTKLGYFANYIGRFSAGCQVIFSAKQFFEEVTPLLSIYTDEYFDYTIIKSSTYKKFAA